MKKKNIKKMTLHRETLHHLDRISLQDVAGGATVRYCNTDISCEGSCNLATTCPTNAC